jgi:hypothetical protein
MGKENYPSILFISLFFLFLCNFLTLLVQKLTSFNLVSPQYDKFVEGEISSLTYRGLSLCYASLTSA